MKAKKTANGNMPKGYETRDQFIQTLQAVKAEGEKAGYGDDDIKSLILDAVGEVFPNLDLSDDSQDSDNAIPVEALAGDGE